MTFDSNPSYGKGLINNQIYKLFKCSVTDRMRKSNKDKYPCLDIL